MARSARSVKSGVLPTGTGFEVWIMEETVRVLAFGGGEEAVVELEGLTAGGDGMVVAVGMVGMVVVGMVVVASASH